MAGLVVQSALALEDTPGETSLPPLEKVPTCAMLEDYEGQVLLVDASRSFLMDTFNRAGIPCGGWISIDQGWAKIKHRSGYRTRVGAHTFVQVAREETEQFVLYRGQVLIESGDGAPEARVLTANARYRLERGRVLVVYNEQDEETQVIALTGEGKFENRFVSENSIALKPGQSSTLHQKALRVLPDTPLAVSTADLRSKLAALHVPEKEKVQILAQAKERADHGLALAQRRSPAGIVFHSKNYERHSRTPDDDALRKKFEAHAVGRGAAGAAGKDTRGPADLGGPSKGPSAELAEKARLLSELSKAREP